MIVKLNDVIARITGNVDRNNTDLLYYVGGEHYDSAELVIPRMGLLNSDEGRKLGFKFHFPFQKGDVLFMARNPHLRKAAMATENGICSDASYILRTKDEKVLRQAYIPILVQQDAFWDYFEANKTGSVNFLMNWKDLKEYEFKLPSIEEQDILCKKVWAAYRLKQEYKKLLASTDELVKSQFIEMFGKHSDVVKLKDVVAVMDDKRKPINEGERSSMKEGNLYPYYGATGVVDYINAYLTDERLLCIAEDCGNYGPGEESSYIIEGKAWVNNHAHVVKPNDELCDITYLHNYLKVTDLLPFVSGTTRKKLTQKAMNDLDIILPPIDKQRDYVSICDQADKSKFELNQSIQDIDKIIRTIIQ